MCFLKILRMLLQNINTDFNLKTWVTLRIEYSLYSKNEITRVCLSLSDFVVTNIGVS